MQIRDILRKMVRHLRESGEIQPAILHLDDEGQEFVAQKGDSILQICSTNNVDIRHYCGGNCTCGTCRVEILDGKQHLSHMNGREQLVIGAECAGNGDRLACQARINGPVRIRIPKWF